MGAFDLGRWGERWAGLYLRSRGYRILHTSWRAGRLGEIDLIVRRGDVLAFVEVKTRRGRSHGPPEEAVGPAKQRRLVRLAEACLAALPDGSPESALRPRLDVIALERSGRVGWRLRHYRGAFEPVVRRAKGPGRRGGKRSPSP